ncbi:Uncharacterised protein [Yersinia mollaretii]|nr:Uncharacterised protein [Yersinia mollaretii]
MNIARALQLMAVLAIEKHDDDLFGMVFSLYYRRLL